MTTIQEQLATALYKNKLTLPPSIQEKLIHFLKLLQAWNRVFNLTTITTQQEMIYLHLIDSLIVAPYLYGNRLLDIGSGGGLPGIPLAILHPQQQWTLLDKNSKKTRFLTQAVAELGLKNVQVVHQRCEDFHPTQCFDSILSRAFGTLRLFVESTEHLLCENGLFIAMKGKYPQTEIAELPERFLLQKAEPLVIKGMDVERHVICLSKKRQ